MSAALARVACVIPAKDEEQRIAATVTAARGLPGVDLVIVCDDGSSDQTPYAGAAEAIVVSHARNRGKAAAVESAVNALGVLEQQDNRPEAGSLLLLDADLGESAANCHPDHPGDVGPRRPDHRRAAAAGHRRGHRAGRLRAGDDHGHRGITELTGWTPRAALRSALPEPTSLRAGQSAGARMGAWKSG